MIDDILPSYAILIVIIMVMTMSRDYVIGWEPDSIQFGESGAVSTSGSVPAGGFGDTRYLQ